MIGSLLLSVRVTTFDHRVDGDASLPDKPRHEVAAKTSHGLAFLPAEIAGGALKQKGVPSPIVSQLEANYSRSQVDALKVAVGGVALIAILGLGVTHRLPSSPLQAPPSEAVQA